MIVGLIDLLWTLPSFLVYFLYTITRTVQIPSNRNRLHSVINNIILVVKVLSSFETVFSGMVSMIITSSVSMIEICSTQVVFMVIMVSYRMAVLVYHAYKPTSSLS